MKTSLKIIVLILLLGCALQAETTNKGGLINSDGCYCTLTGPDVVCRGETFIVHAHIVHNNGSSAVTPVDYKVSVSGAGGTANPTDITTCPADQDITVVPTNAGTLVLHVGSVTHFTTVLTDTSGEFTIYHNADPNLPDPFDVPYDLDGPANLFTGGQENQFHYTGTLKHAFDTFRDATNWKPNANGLDCGQKQTITSSITGTFGLNINVLGLNLGISGSYTQSLSMELGGVPNKRWRAYPVWPREKITNHVTAVQIRDGNIIGGWGPWSPAPSQIPPDAVVATDYLSGKDWHTEAACCP
jgi:hypothetical protein